MTLTEVHDNYLSKNDFNQLKKLLLGNNFSYYLQDCIVSEGDGFFQFTHIFYDDQVIKSKHFDNLHPILDKLNPVSLIKIKANLQIKDTEIVTTDMHRDIEFGYSNFRDPIENQKTGIFYMNTNNGKTIFEDGEEIESVENRLIIFPASKFHAGTTHTDTRYRCVINLNWF
tara:strand:- start:106 stop:618 length:513 start_codon:yes stop_codon:yes gene_type:complete